MQVIYSDYPNECFISFDTLISLLSTVNLLCFYIIFDQFHVSSYILHFLKTFEILLFFRTNDMMGNEN